MLQVNEIQVYLQSLEYWPIPMTGQVPEVVPQVASKIHELTKDLMTICMEMCRLSNSMRRDVRSYLTATAEEYVLTQIVPACIVNHFSRICLDAIFSM